MSAEIASLDRVRNAVATLRQRGAKATADRVIELIGGGSKSTVLDHLRTLRSAPTEPEEVPPSVFEIVRPALSEIYAAGRRHEADRHRAAWERLSSIVEDQDAQIIELDEQSKASEIALQALRKELAEKELEESDVRAELHRTQEANAALRAQLDAEREEDADGLKAALARFEALVEEASTAKRRGGGALAKAAADA